MQKYHIFSLILLCFFALSSPSLAVENSFETNIGLFQQGEYEKAAQGFRSLIQTSGESANLVTNWGLCQAKLNKVGWAAGAFRRALALSPGHREAQRGLDFLTSQGKIRELPHEIELWESFRVHILNFGTVELWFFLCLVTFVGSSWSALQFWGARRRALAEDLISPRVPIVGVTFFILFVVTAVLLSAKWRDSLESRTTVVVEKSALLTSPHADSPALLELNEGLEVVVRRVQADWIQVTYPGSVTGWTKLENLYPLQSR